MTVSTTTAPAAPSSVAPSSPANDPRAQRPPEVPAKFWDAATGTVRVDALLKSYLHLEQKLGRPSEDPADPEARARMLSALGVPDDPTGYAIEAPNDLLTPDDDLNRVLHGAGFTQEQVQLVYNLAADRLMPIIAEAVAEVEAERHKDRLAARFGGEEAWRERARQINTWAKANLPPDVVGALASSFDGVLALDTMMKAKEPRLGTGAEAAAQGGDEAALRSMIDDPRYWRDRDPTFIAKVTAGFRRLYPS